MTSAFAEFTHDKVSEVYAENINFKIDLLSTSYSF